VEEREMHCVKGTRYGRRWAAGGLFPKKMLGVTKLVVCMVVMNVVVLRGVVGEVALEAALTKGLQGSPGSPVGVVLMAEKKMLTNMLQMRDNRRMLMVRNTKLSSVVRSMKKIMCLWIVSYSMVPNQVQFFAESRGESRVFFQIPVFGAKGTTPSKDTTTAFITVKKGAVSPNLIRSEMARLIPVRWQWTVQAHSDGFVVPFPSIVELQRMVAVKYVHTAGGEGIMLIQQLDQNIEPVQMLLKAWINVYGVPFEIRSFLPLWAIGSILGSTQKVDLRYTKRMGVCRLMVGVTDVAKIPDAADIVVGEGIYEIFF
jgi:hypothetical protein